MVASIATAGRKAHLKALGPVLDGLEALEGALQLLLAEVQRVAVLLELLLGRTLPLQLRLVCLSLQDASRSSATVA